MSPAFLMLSIISYEVQLWYNVQHASLTPATFLQPALCTTICNLSAAIAPHMSQHTVQHVRHLVFCSQRAS